MRLLAVALAVTVLVAAACGAETSASTIAPSTTTTTTAASTTTTPTPTPTTTTMTTTTTTVTTTTPAPVFSSSIAPVTAAELGASWHEGCPVAVDELRALTLAHWDDEGIATEGVLVVHRDHTADIVFVFGALFDAGFPMASMRPVSHFAADDDASMAADNTSAFNCREVTGRPGVWSQHSYGAAIDINPLRNPFIRGSTVEPPGGASFVDRTVDDPGLIRSGDAVTAAFAAIGWGWGGVWSSPRDYQHFSANGR